MKNRKDILEKIRCLRLMDDEFMTICFDGYKEGVKLLLKIILGRDDLKISEVRTQKALKNLHGHDSHLDIYATDSQGKKYNIEIQRADSGAIAQRARYHSSMVDADMLAPGDTYSNLNESYVIFITENDVLGDNKPIYHIDRRIEESDYRYFADGSHIIYVNGAIKDDTTDLGKLMSDFYCTKAQDMHYKELRNKVKYYKETKKGVETMSSVFDDFRNECKIEEKEDIAIKMIKDSMPYEKVAEYSGLPIEKIRELAERKPA